MEQGVLGAARKRRQEAGPLAFAAGRGRAGEAAEAAGVEGWRPRGPVMGGSSSAGGSPQREANRMRTGGLPRLRPWWVPPYVRGGTCVRPCRCRSVPQFMRSGICWVTRIDSCQNDSMASKRNSRASFTIRALKTSPCRDRSPCLPPPRLVWRFDSLPKPTAPASPSLPASASASSLPAGPPVPVRPAPAAAAADRPGAPHGAGGRRRGGAAVAGADRGMEQGQ